MKKSEQFICNCILIPITIILLTIIPIIGILFIGLTLYANYNAIKSREEEEDPD